jgi:lipopolysaccharide/colanic/teichoic acid biosynthesis glycosyltransferase
VAERQAGGLAALEQHAHHLGAADRGPLSAAAKRALDLAVAGLALIVLAPLFILLAALVVIDSGLPVFHRRRVLGRGSVPFDAWKFRTMRPAGRPAARQPIEGPATTAGGLPSGTLTFPDDPRITRVGRWLRRLSLDELPQLFNVLRGEMSLVGPRMLAPEEHAALTAFPEWQRSVLAVKPGMTGPWQVSGRRTLPYEERVRLDLEYVRGATLWTDVLVLFRTVPAVVGGRGAF